MTSREPNTLFTPAGRRQMRSDAPDSGDRIVSHQGPAPIRPTGHHGQDNPLSITNFHIGEVLVFQLEPTTPPPWTNGMKLEEWQHDSADLC